ncbi:FHA domain-containing protein [Corynebacterium auriscanis]|uniref:FHA domain-containing protein n=1 Tax=Corynebacterium auriscanis TaxID=99807 RepID=UPI00399D5B69
MGSAFAASAGSASAGNADAAGADLAGADFAGANTGGASAGNASAASAGNTDAAGDGSAGAASAGTGASTVAPQNNDSHNDNDHARRAHGDSLSANEGWDGDQGGVDGTESPTPNQPQAQQPSYPGTEIIAQAAPDTPVNGGEGYADEESDMRVILHLRDGSDRKYWLQEGSNIIGRGNGVDLRIPDTGVSRQHADIVWDGYDAVLTDLNSTNGTTVNDTPVENWLLADGDLIVVGHSEILVRFTQN